jgi:hypothetical protein
MPIAGSNDLVKALLTQLDYITNSSVQSCVVRAHSLLSPFSLLQRDNTSPVACENAQNISIMAITSIYSVYIASAELDTPIGISEGEKIMTLSTSSVLS